MVEKPFVDLKYSIGINLDLMANIYDADGQFKRKIGEVSKETFEAIQNLIDGPDPSKADFLERGEKPHFEFYISCYTIKLIYTVLD